DCTGTISGRPAAAAAQPSERRRTGSRGARRARLGLFLYVGRRWSSGGGLRERPEATDARTSRWVGVRVFQRTLCRTVVGPERRAGGGLLWQTRGFVTTGGHVDRQQ